MISVNIAFDNDDRALGEFFRRCKDDLISFLKNQEIDGAAEYDVHEIHSERCSVDYMNERLPEINGKNFLFIAYSHGDVDCLSAGGASYIDSGINPQIFKNSFFYAVACKAGAGLGLTLVGKGSHTFIGYWDEYKVPNLYVPLLVNCVNVGMKMFLNGQTARESFRQMRQYYDQKIDQLTELNAIIPASILVGNREALVFFGREDLTIADFNV